jgi:hypothetical protein
LPDLAFLGEAVGPTKSSRLIPRLAQLRSHSISIVRIAVASEEASVGIFDSRKESSHIPAQSAATAMKQTIAHFLTVIFRCIHLPSDIKKEANCAT